MTGAFLNAIGILLGALFGLAQRAPLSARTQDFFRRALGVATVFIGLRLVWLHVNGTFWPCAKQLLIALIAVTLGNWTGRLLRLQKISNRLGRFASRAILFAQTGASRKFGNGFIACVVLFCAAPLGLIGAVTDGLSGDFYLLAVKAVMDGLAMAGFVKMFGWPAALSAFPVYAFLGAITLACQFYAKPLLDAPGLIDSVNVAGGLVACAIALVIFEIRRVELANYLPALAVAPLLARLIG
ncbi:MAG: DUF554 family protein [Verrucomicrobiales bacterium]|nr:DUF554 family protein [Verrucomicrobiales bacterium]